MMLTLEQLLLCVLFKSKLWNKKTALKTIRNGLMNHSEYEKVNNKMTLIY